MLFTGWEVRAGKIFCRNLKNMFRRTENTCIAKYIIQICPNISEKLLHKRNLT